MFLFETTLLQTFLNSYVRRIAHCAVFSRPMDHNTVLSNSTSRGLPKLRDLWDAHTSGSTPFPYTTGRHPALRENLFPTVVLVVFLNFHWLILFPRTLISLLVKVLLFCHYQSRQFFIKCQKAPNRCCGLMMRKPKLAMFKSVCKCQTSSASSQWERWLLFHVGKEKG